MMRAHLPILPVLVPLAASLLVPIVALAARPAAAALAGGAGALTAAAALAGLMDVAVRGPQRYAVGGWPPPWGIEVVLDPLSAFTASAVSCVAAVTLATCGGSVRAVYGRGAPAFYALALLVLTGLVGIIVSGDLFNIFVFLEVAAIASYALVASGGGPALAAAFRYVLLGTVGASFYLLGVGFLYALTGTLNMADLAHRLPAVSGSPLFAGGVVFVFVGLAIKMGLFPLHAWLPDAYARAPAPVAAFIAPIGTKAAAYVLARALLHVLRPGDLGVHTVLAWMGALAIVAGGVLALRQADARRLLAYSSVSQMGYIVLGLGVANGAALAGAYLHILNHTIMKAALFIAVGAVAARGHGVAVGALERGMPVTATCAVVAALSLVGVPPAGGFFSKWYLLQGAIEAGQPGLVTAILLGSLLGAVYMYRLTERVWFPHSPRGRAPTEAPRMVLAGLALLAAAVVAVGLGNAVVVGAVLGPAVAGAR